MSQSKSELEAKLAQIEDEYESATKAAKKLKHADAVINEGGEGFSQYESTTEALYEQYAPQITSLKNAIFAAEWTQDVTAKRSADWNAEISQHKRITPKLFNDIVAKLGYSLNDIKRAKSINSK